MKLLIIGAHLDDSIIAAGGIIRRVADEGGQVDVVCFGNSDEDFADVRDKGTVSSLLTAKAREAHAILGVKSFTCFGYSDYAVQENRETYRLCIESIRKHRPDVILSHYWAEYFQHRAVARLACDAWWQAGWTCSADLGRAWTAKALYHFEVIHALPEPSDIVDVSDSFDRKIEAWQCFNRAAQERTDQRGKGPERAYGATAGGTLAEQIEARARYHGSQIGTRYGEALKRSYYLPRPVRSINRLFED
jgi:LmbE family N-acetylglucosaminyl deacetylase